MEFTFYNSYVILELVPSTDFLDRPQLLAPKLLKQATLFLCWSHRYKNTTVFITIWLTVTKYTYLKWQWIFYSLRRCFLFSVTTTTFTGLDYVLLTFLVVCFLFSVTTTTFTGLDYVLLTFLVVCWCYCVFLRSEFCDVIYDFSIQTIFGSSLPPVVCMRVHVLFTLCVFVCV
jgi:hypothetical protein